jgi:hypothetical protein
MVVGRAQRVIVWRLRRDEATVERLCSGGCEATFSSHRRASRL